MFIDHIDGKDNEVNPNLLRVQHEDEEKERNTNI